MELFTQETHLTLEIEFSLSRLPDDSADFFVRV